MISVIVEFGRQKLGEEIRRLQVGMAGTRGERHEFEEAYIKASIKAGMSEGENSGDSSGGTEEEAFPTQGSVMFRFRFEDELRVGACNAMGVLRSEASVRPFIK